MALLQKAADPPLDSFSRGVLCSRAFDPQTDQITTHFRLDFLRCCSSSYKTCVEINQWSADAEDGRIVLVTLQAIEQTHFQTSRVNDVRTDVSIVHASAAFARA